MHHHKVTRRAVLQLLGGAAGVTLLAACAPIAPAAAPAGQAAPAAGQPKTGGTLKVGVTAELPNLESHLVAP